MRGFLVLSLIAVASAAGLGYDYRPIGSGIGISSGSSYNTGLGGSLSGLSLGGGSLGGGSLGGGSLGGGLGLGSSFGGGSYSGGGIGGGLVSSGGLGGGLVSSGGYGSGSQNSGIISGSAPLVTELNKEYYFHSAPEEEFNDGGATQRITNTLKKNLRVVFIKTPENNGITNAAINIAKQAVEDRTAIYVLTKQNDVSDFAQQLQQISEIRSAKPEVRFVKYRTPQDALNAQHAIQSQYDALGGSTKSSDEGVAPVLNYASSSPVVSHIGSGSELSSSGSGSSGSISAPSGSYLAPKNNYLPPVVL